MTELPFTEASSYNKPIPIHIQRQQVQRKRKTQCWIDGTTRRENLIGEGGVSAIPSDVLHKIQRIATPEILSMLWHYLRAKRTSPLREDLGDTPLTTERSDTSIEGLLSRY
jgi:hypothetical protein